MKNLTEVMDSLRRKNIGQYGLLSGCCFFSVLLISAYVTMMRSETVLKVLPEGGDSRKQVMMIFVLAAIGCAVFTTYASGLFFRYKSREVGIFLALGATKHTLRHVLIRELLFIAILSCVSGILLGTPLAFLLWQGFRMFVVDSQEMRFAFDPQAFLFGIAFSVFVFAMLFVMLSRFLKRTNILDVVNESRKTELVRLVPKYYGWLGIVLVFGGCLLGYQIPSVFIYGLKWYPPSGLTSIFYLPALVGLYMVLLHTVVNGWRRGKSRYKGIVSTSMMQFQGRQTVRNMIVVSVLVAGAFFASFYTPLMATTASYSFETRTIDYLFHYRADQNMPGEEEIRTMANDMGVVITRYASGKAAVLGVDGEEFVEKEGAIGTAFTYEYRELLSGEVFLSESTYNALTGQNVDIEPGTVAAIFTDEGQSEYRTSNEVGILTNTATGERFFVTPRPEVLCNTMLFGKKVLDDADYLRMTAQLTDEWKEEIVAFDVENVEESYAFSKALFHEIVRRSGPEVELFDAWDPVKKLQAEQANEPYSFDSDQVEKHGFSRIRYENMDSSEFRLYWKYMPQFRILDQLEYVQTMAVFLLLFVFIAIICFAACMVILFTRSMTIAITNRQVYEDLGKMGASRQFLYQTVKNQIGRIFVAPIVTGTLLIGMFYTMILYFNDGMISKTELLGSRNCLVVVASVLLLFYVLFKVTLWRVCRKLFLLSK